MRAPLRHDLGVLDAADIDGVAAVDLEPQADVRDHAPEPGRRP